MAFAIEGNNSTLQKLRASHRDLSGGPRYMTFHPDGRHLSVLLETKSEVVVFTIDLETGTLSDDPNQRFPPTQHGGRSVSSVNHMTPDASWLYAFNRRDQSKGRFAGSSEGTLSFLGVTKMDRRPAWRWAMAPDNSHTVVATLLGSLTRWEIDRDTGNLRPTY